MKKSDRKKRKEIIKELKNDVKNRKTLKEFALERYVDDEGIANIHVEINEDNTFEQYAIEQNKTLSQELLEYIESEAYYIPVIYPIRIIFHANFDIKEDEIEKMLKDYYWKKTVDKNDDLRTNRLISNTLFGIGVLFMIIYFIFEFNPNANILFTEIFSIIASFAIWEAVDYFIIGRNEIKIQYLNTVQLAKAKIKVIKK